MREDIRVRFFQPRHGIYRTIPTRLERDSSRYRFRFTDIVVEGFDFTVSSESNMLKIRIGSESRYVEGTQVYTLYYTVQNPIFVFSNEQKEPWQAFYWNLIGTDWEVPIRQASFEVVLDKAWENPVWSVFVGHYGEKNVDRVKSWYDEVNHTLKGHLVGELTPREGITLIAAFPMDFWPLVDVKTFWDKYGGMLSLGVLILYILLLFVLWRLFGRDKPFVKMAHFYPPQDIHPAEAGMLIDNSIDQRDVIATIVKWAVDGYIVIEEVSKSHKKRADFVFHKKKELENPRDFERILWKGFFDDAGQLGKKDFRFSDVSNSTEKVTLSSLGEEFVTAFRLAHDRIGESVKEKSLYRPWSRELGWLCVFFLVWRGFLWGFF